MDDRTELKHGSRGFLDKPRTASSATCAAAGIARLFRSADWVSKAWMGMQEQCERSVRLRIRGSWLELQAWQGGYCEDANGTDLDAPLVPLAAVEAYAACK